MKLGCAFVCLLGSALFAQQLPHTMTKIVAQLQSSDVPADSFAAKPKTIFRAGTQYCRVEEAPDPEHGIHGLMIVNEPDAWMVNLATKNAQHMVDPGPTFNCRLPIFANRISEVPQDEAKAIGGLEFGNEFDFFKSKGATQQTGPVLQTKQTTMYKLQFGDSALALFTYGTPERPLAVAWTRGDKHDIFWYSGYGQVDFDPALFAKPSGVAIEDVKQ
jgi:hypothetical protein